MTTNDSSVRASRCGIHMGGIGIHLPGDPISLADVNIPDDVRKHLSRTGQEITYRSDLSSTELAIAAAREALEKSGFATAEIGLIISAPTLLTGYGLEIPAVAVRAALGLDRAECLNISQGCVGALAALRVAAHFLKCEPDRGHVLIVTACKASSLVRNFTHGAFSWGDAGGAVVVTGNSAAGLQVEYYAEIAAETDWGAMRIPFGDATGAAAVDPENDLRISVEFPDHEAQIEYIVSEKTRCSALIDALTSAADIAPSDIDAVFLPSFGRKRVPILLEEHPVLIDRVATDFQYAHLGSVDVLYFLDLWQRQNTLSGQRLLALSPAFTAQWGGVLLNHHEP